MTVDELQVLITANTTQLQNEINKTQSTLNALQKSTNKTSNAIVSGFKWIKTGISALGIGALIKKITGDMSDAVKRLDALNNFPRVMSNLGISNEDAQASIDLLSEKLKGLPTTLDDASLAVQRFTSANGNVKASTVMFLGLNDAILAGGASSEIQKSALEQLSQAYAKGKPDMMEWRTAMMAMPAQLKQVALAMGYISADQLGEALRNGKVSMNEFMATIARLDKEGANGFASFRDQAMNSAGGVATSMTNVKTAITRGLADIMNAIGQTNISGFFNGIAKAVGTVTNYVVAFVRVMAMAISYISALFGGASKGMSGVSKQNTAVSNSLNSLGTSGGNASKGIDKTTGSAKKLKKELLGLAGFDEMTVLKEQDNSTSGGSGGSSAGGVGGVGALNGIDLSAFENDTKDVSDKVQEIVNKMLKFFEPLSRINLKPLRDSLKNLWEAIKPVAEIISDALYSAYKKVLVPLAKFTIEKALPAFFDLLTNSIKLLTPVIKAFKNAGKWLLENFLTPIAKFTGKAIISTLNGLSGAIKKLADNINQSKTAQKILDGIATAILSLVTAYEIFKVSWTIGTLIQSGVTAFTAMLANIKVVTTAMQTMTVASALCSSQLTIQELAVALLTGQMTLHEVATAIATKAQLAFNAALTANPIGLVVAAIALLVAGTIALVSWLNSGTEAEKEQAEAMKELAEETENTKNKYYEMQEQQQQAINSGLSEIQHTQELANELRLLSDEQGNVAEKDRARAQFILNELNEALGTEYTMIDGQIQKYAELSATIDEQIEKKRIQCLLDAREVEYKEALSKWSDIQKQKDEAYLELQKAMEDFDQHRSKANAKRLLSAQEAYNNLRDTQNACAKDIQMYEDAMTANLEGNTKKAESILMNKEYYFQSYENTVEAGAVNQTRILKDQQDSAIRNFIDYRNKMKEGAMGVTADGLQQAQEYASKAITEYQKVGENMNKGLYNGLDATDQDLIRQILQEGTDIKSNFESSLDMHSPSRKFYTYGQNINTGIVNGLNGNKSSTLGAIGNIASGLLSRFKSVLQIHSPSKVFYGLGENTIQGYVNAIDENKKYAVRSIERMSKDIAQADITPSLNNDFDMKRNINLTNTLSNQNLIDKVAELTDKDINNQVIVKIGEDTIFDRFIENIKEKNFETNGEAFSI